MKDENMKERILKWIEETGYPLEMRSEKVISNQGFRAWNSMQYKDDELSKIREIDLYATYSLSHEEVSLDIALLIECKSSKKPFIQLANRNKHELDGCFHLGENYYTDNAVCSSLFASRTRKIELPGNSCSSFKMIQGFTNTDETIYKAGNTLTKSFRHFVQESDELSNDFARDNFHLIYVPVLVIDSPMFKLSLDHENATQLEEIQSSLLSFGFASQDDISTPFTFPVIHIDHLAEFALNVIKSGNSLLEGLVLNPKLQLKNIVKTKSKQG